MKTRTQFVVVCCLVGTLVVSVASLHALWIADGSPVCTAPNNQNLPGMTTDGAGGAIIAWTDVRSGDFDIYAQRVDERGAIIAWEEGSGDAIHAQRVDANGNPLWTAGGVDVCSAAGAQNYARIVSDGAGGAIIAWEDNRGSFADVYIQRLSAAGAVQWTADGEAVCTALWDQEYVQMVSDGDGGAILAWEGGRNNELDIFGSRMDANGQQVPTFLETCETSVREGIVVVQWSGSAPSRVGHSGQGKRNMSGTEGAKTGPR